jgi:hypothetical protein
LKSGTQTLVNNATTAPSYADKVSKNSAYNRSWRFGP